MVGRSMFITGASGFLGSHLLARSCQDADISSVYALARSNSDKTASDRIAEALAHADFKSNSLEYKVLEADITQPLCNVDPFSGELSTNAAQDITFLHVAATLDWQPSRRTHIELTNEIGTRNALSLARKIGTKSFIYVSTAYTCGKEQGSIEECLHSNSAGFNNLYEYSKFNAERHVAEYCTQHKMPFIIMRPSIILGSSHNYQASGSDTGLYGLIQELRQIGKRALATQETVRLRAAVDSLPSLIPVNSVVDQIFSNLSYFHDDPSQNIFHVTPRLDEQSANAGEIFDYLFAKLECRDLFQLVDYEIDDKTRLERFLARRMSFFSPYFNSTKIFSRKLETESSLSFTEVQKYIDNETAQLVVPVLQPKTADSIRCYADQRKQL